MSRVDTATRDLLAEIDEGVAVLTFNRPRHRNAFTVTMLDELARLLADFETDDNVGCVMLTGAGGAFCAGADVTRMAGGSGDGRQRRSIDDIIQRQRQIQQATSGQLWSMSKPTIAAIPGAAAGAGLALALACDLRYAASGSVFTTAFARIGFSGDFGGTWFLNQLVGSAKAKELFFFSERFSAEEAERLGIVNAVFGPDQLQSEVTERARRLATGPRVAHRYMKENLNRAIHGDLRDCMDIEAVHHNHTGLTEDHREGVLAFVEKREPRFRGL